MFRQFFLDWTETRQLFTPEVFDQSIQPPAEAKRVVLVVFIYTDPYK